MFNSQNYEEMAEHMVDELLSVKQRRDIEEERPLGDVHVLKTQLESELPSMLRTLFNRANLEELLRHHEILE